MSPVPYAFRRPLVLAVAAYALAAAALRLWLPPGPPAGDAARFAGGGRAVLRGRVAQDPELRGGRFRFVLEVRGVAAGPGGFRPARGRARVTVDDPAFDAGWGDEVEVSGAFSRPAGAAAPGAFDYRAFLAERNVHSLLRADPGGWRLLRPAPPWSPFLWLGLARARFFDAFDRHLDPHAAALMAGLVLGKKPAAYPEMDGDFRRSGAYHLLVASGSNVGFALALWFLVGRWVLGLPRRPLWALAAFWAFVYAGLAGADPPVVRAALMTALGIAGALMAREDRLEHAVAFSFGALLLLRPRALFEAGFQMSYAATFGVVAAAPALEALFRPAEEGAPRWRRRLFRLAQPFAISAAAQLALAPLLVHYFHRFSWIGLLTNVAAVPWAAVCVALGAGLLLLDLLWPAGAVTRAWAWAAEASAEGLWSCVAFFAKAPAAELTPLWTGGQVAVFAAAVAAALFFVAAGLRGWKTALAFWLAAAPAWLWAGRKPPAEELAITWLDAGLGDAAVVETPAGAVTVVDAGSASAGAYRLAPYLRRLRVRRIDRFVLTHADPPHAGGLEELAEEFEIGQLLCTEATWRSPVWSHQREMLERRRVPRRFLQSGDYWEDGPVRWRVLSPEAGDPGDPDAQSLVLLLEYGAAAALLSADAPPARQRLLAEGIPALSVLQWPHHGRRPFPGFLSAGRPRWLVVSGEEAGPYPASFSLGGAVRVTGRDGSLRWTSDGSISRLEKLAAAPPDVVAAR
jgi:competence protein ComEC